MNTNLEALLSWGRYLHWAHLAYESLSSTQQEAVDQSTTEIENRMFAHSARWLGCLYVVLEGWRELELKDPIIDALLCGYTEYCEALRRFRNAVFHYQKEMYDERMLNFTRRYSQSLLWAATLHFEFQRYLWQWPDSLIGTIEEKDEVRNSMKAMIGWLPTDIIAARIDALQKLSHDAQLMLESDGSPSSPEAEELREAINLVNSLIKSTDISPLVIELMNSSKRLNQ